MTIQKSLNEIFDNVLSPFQKTSLIRSEKFWSIIYQVYDQVSIDAGFARASLSLDLTPAIVNDIFGKALSDPDLEPCVRSLVSTLKFDDPVEISEDPVHLMNYKVLEVRICKGEDPRVEQRLLYPYGPEGAASVIKDWAESKVNLLGGVLDCPPSGFGIKLRNPDQETVWRGRYRHLLFILLCLQKCEDWDFHRINQYLLNWKYGAEKSIHDSLDLKLTNELTAIRKYGEKKNLFRVDAWTRENPYRLEPYGDDPLLLWLCLDPQLAAFFFELIADASWQ